MASFEDEARCSLCGARWADRGTVCPTWLPGMAVHGEHRYTIEVSAIAAALDGLAAKYPTDVFPDDSDSPDAKAARMARHTVDNLRRALLGEVPPEEERHGE